MRLDAIDLQAYGGFSGYRIELDPERPFTVLYGDNEAGKSTTMRALRGLLYGFGHRAEDDWLHDRAKLRVGAVVTSRDGRSIELVRKRGNRNTLLDADGAPVEEAVLARLLRGVDRQLFERRFGIDHAQLQAGGQQLLCVDGSAGESLFAAASGLTRLRSTLASITDELAGLLSEAGKKGAIYDASRAYDRASERLAELRGTAGQFGRLVQQRDEAEQRLEQLAVEARAAEAELVRLQRVGRVLPLLPRRRSLQAEIAAHGALTALPPGARQEREGVLELQREALRWQEEAGRRLEELDALLARLDVCEPLLDAEAEIERLATELGAWRSAVAELPLQSLEVEQAREQLSEARLRAAASGDAEARLPAAEEARIRELLDAWPALEAALQQAASDRSDAALAVDQAGARLEELAEPTVDPAVLEQALAAAAEVDEGELRQREGELAALREQLDDQVRALPGWGGSLDDLARAPVPLPARVDHHEQLLARHGQESAAQQSRLGQAGDEIASIDRQLAELRSVGELPQREQLADARRQRDEAWAIVRAAWLTDDRSAPAWQRLPDDQAAASELERATTAVDARADELLREADRATRVEVLEHRRRTWVQQEAAARGRLEELATAADESRQAWAGAWAAAGVEAAGPAAMREWLQRRDRVLEQRDRLLRESRELEQLRAAARERRDELHQLLAGLVDDGRPAVSAGDPVAAGRRLLDRLRAEYDQRQLLRHRLEDARVRLASAAARHAEAAARVEAWRDEWAAAVSPLSLAVDASPAAVRAALEARRELGQVAERVAAREAALAASQAVVEGFAAAAEELRNAVAAGGVPVASELEGASAGQVVEQLAAGLRRSQRDAGRRAAAAAERDTRASEQLAAAATLRSLDARVQQLLEAARCTTVDELAQLEHRHEQVQALRARLAEVDAEIASAAADGRPVDDVVAEAEAVPADELPALVAEQEASLSAIAGQHARLQAQRDEVVGQLAQIDASCEERELVEERAELRSRLERLVARYTQLRLAATVLGEAIERYRRHHQGPLLLRASEIFFELTGGRYERLVEHVDANDDVVIVGECRSGALVHVADMSDGTRDQLYLALRLATIHEHLDGGGEPIPVVVDDILLTFDDERAAATMRQLAQLAARTQVLFFTHHRRLQELAGREVPHDMLLVHELDGAAGRVAEALTPAT